MMICILLANGYLANGWLSKEGSEKGVFAMKSSSIG
jgi:hypothetical protein